MNLMLFFLLFFFKANSINQNFYIDLMHVKSTKDGSLNKSFVKKINKIFNSKMFIETGTYLGNTALRAKEFFDEVHTIEVEKSLYLKAKERFSGTINLNTHFGDSGEIISSLISSNKKTATIWLDGHFSGFHDGHQTGMGALNTPIKAELESIKRGERKDYVLMIDDIRLFDHTVENLDNLIIGHYPSLDSICKIIKEINKNYKILIMGDVLLAYVENKKIESSAILEAITISRLFNNDNNLYTSFDVIAAEKVISEATDSERYVIKELNDTFGSDLHAIDYGVARHYNLWEALILLKKDPKKSLILLKHVYDKGMTHWRIKMYMSEALFNNSQIKESEELINELIDNVPEFKAYQLVVNKNK